MGYHLTILRTQTGKLLPITRAEFLEVCRSHPRLVIHDDLSLARLMAGDELIATLKHQDGEIWTGVADTEVIAVMLELAGKLQARVRGDEGETYRSVSDTYTHPDDEVLSSLELLDVKHVRWKKAFWNILRLLALLLTIGLIVANKLRP